ncbi:UbiA prenyltransferase [gamma proteobacterium NOR5-3]|nr:UbiA prenyltransferase [gamma proteobacterium NOR5-3]
MFVMLNPSVAATLGPMRAPFLLLVPVVVGLGAASAVSQGVELNLSALVLTFVGALSAHVAVNALNEYEDFRSGLDLITERTPFSGGTGTLPAYPEKAHYALVVGMLAVALVAIIGLWLCVSRGYGVLVPGVVGVAIILAYTRFITRSPLLCLVAPGVAFGPLMVMGTDYVLTGTYSEAGAYASLLPLFLVSNLLLMNQFPDIEADTRVGRRHLLIRYGTGVGVTTFGVFLLAAYGSVLFAVAAGVLPVTALISLLTLPIGVRVWQGLRRHAHDIPLLLPYMGQNVLLTLLTPTLLAFGLLLAV